MTKLRVSECFVSKTVIFDADTWLLIKQEPPFAWSWLYRGALMQPAIQA